MKTPKEPEDMPFGVGVVFAVLGTAVLTGVLSFWAGPAVWVRVAYRPAAATVTDKRLNAEPAKGGALHRLEVLLHYQVDGQGYDGWVELPQWTRKTTGPEAEAVLGQLAVGEEVTCYHDPVRPGAGVVLDNRRLRWTMLPALILPALMGLAGVGGMIGSYRKTFPRGVTAAVADLRRRVPGRFYPAAAGTLAAAAGTLAAAAGVVLLRRHASALGGWACPLQLVGLGAAALLLWRATRLGAVALPSPERRAAARLTAAPPAAGTPAPPAGWSPVEPVAVGRGTDLPVRLKSDWARGPVLVAAALALSGMLVLGFVLVKLAWWLAAGLPPGLGGPASVALAVLSLLAAGGPLFGVGRRGVRRVRGLAVELSAHPVRAGETYRLTLHHPEPDVAGRVRLELVCEEEMTTGGRNKSTTRRVALRQPVALQEVPGRAGARAGRLDVPAGSPPSFRLEYHQVTWRLEARVGRGFLWNARYPVTVHAGGAAGRAAPEPGKPPRLDDGVAALWLDGAAVLAPGDTLSGGYEVRPADDGPLRTVELSVLWTTEAPTELGVCHYEGLEAYDDGDLRPYRARAFRCVLPGGTPSYDGQAVKVRWAVRLRLRYVNGAERLRELPFRLTAGG